MKRVAVAVAACPAQPWRSRVAVGRAKAAMKGMALYLVIGLSAVVPLLGQVELHGQVYPLVRLTFEQRYLTLPQRFVTLEGQRRGRNASLFFNTTLEYRLATNSAAVELQEAYAEFSTGLGEFRFGQQVIAWGATDGNNPTDNVNPYDFYYLFMPGPDRKVGNVMATANLYLGPVNLEAVATPVFQPNRLPLDEPDFPIMGDISSQLMSLEERPSREIGNTEIGLRTRLPLSIMDLSFSYFRGFERMFTPIVGPHGGDQSLQYNSIEAFGGDFVTFLGDWAVRAEGAYFLTDDKEGNDSFVRNPYFQYVLQLDRTADKFSFMAQYLGTAITRIDGDDVLIPPMDYVLYTEEENERDNIPPKMGMPFAAIAQNAVLATASRDFADGRISLQGQALYDLDHDGYMVGAKATFTLEEAFDLELGVTYMGGEEGSRLHSIGEVFSHAYLGLKYSF